MNLINPLELFGPDLNLVQSPSRYIGGEYGITKKIHDGSFYLNVGIAFPDLYEIAMSNLAVKIIYNGLNSLQDVRCERVFAPDVDFENYLRQKDVPLYTLETGMPLDSLDLLGFSIGYELGITEVLAMLETGKIPLFSKDRRDSDPIVFAGGCGVTNPASVGDFFDAVFIGEAEDALFLMVNEISALKKKGASRAQILDFMRTKPFMWFKDQQDKISYRTVQKDFGLKPSVPDWFPLPSSKPVQDHGVIEIMRGCPNGCRFCHAGIYYRPARVKNLGLIIQEIDHLVFDAGYREISLNSLSSADFPDVASLLDILNERYKGFNVSFQLPSLKVNSLSLDILEKLSQVRKSGLTFAVETPEEAWQLSLNKEVYAQHLEEIILEAKKRGWSSAKFYFMIGLPFGTQELSEEKAIVDFLVPLQARTKMQFNVNVGVFIPKPHTAYQWVKQISVEEARKKMDYIYENLPRGKFKLGRHNFDTTVLEGLLSRGDSRMAGVIYSAYKKGVRFDAWDDYLRNNFKLWEEAFAQADWNVYDYIYKDWSLDEKLPWDSVSLGPSKLFYKKEWEKSLRSQLTEKCTHDCPHPCGICNQKNAVEVHAAEKVKNSFNQDLLPAIDRHPIRPECNIPVLYRVVFSFERKNGGEYNAYLYQVETFHKAILRSRMEFVFTTGFNPLPRLEFASAMSLGIPSDEEIASCMLYDYVEPDYFLKTMNEVLPEYFNIKKAFVFPVTNLRKRESLSSSLWGADYRYRFFSEKDADLVMNSFALKDFLKKYPKTSFSYVSADFNKDVMQEWKHGITELYARFFSSDKKFRECIEEITGQKWFKICSVEKIHTLAVNKVSGWTAKDEDNWRHNSRGFIKENDFKVSDSDAESPVSYFELYERIAAVNKDLIEKRKELQVERDSFFKEKMKENPENPKNSDGIKIE